MATASASPTTAKPPAATGLNLAAPEAAVADRKAGEAVKALVPAPQPQQNENKPAFPAVVLRLPVDLVVSVPVRDFRVRQLLALAPGQVIETQWNHGDDLPLTAGEVEVAWSEFEVVETQLAVRITRLE
ncbi:MAG: FliM/FliN family flagellar motor switch protein [Terracidiphilus sp.]